MRTGFEKVTQVLGDALLREIADEPEERKLVAFTDSRQDAAKLSAGIERRHYEDTVRQLLASADGRLGPRTRGPRRSLSRCSRGDELRPRGRAALSSGSALPIREDAAATDGGGDGVRDSGRRQSARRQCAAQIPAFAVSLRRALIDETERRLLALGMNPAGPDRQQADRSVALTGSWTSLFDFASDPPAREAPRLPQPAAVDWLSETPRTSLRLQALRLVFAARRRDFESIGLGWVDRPARSHRTRRIALSHERQAADAALRILGERASVRAAAARARRRCPPPSRDYLARRRSADTRSTQPSSPPWSQPARGARRHPQWVRLGSQLRLTPAAGKSWPCAIAARRISILRRASARTASERFPKSARG